MFIIGRWNDLGPYLSFLFSYFCVGHCDIKWASCKIMSYVSPKLPYWRYSSLHSALNLLAHSEIHTVTKHGTATLHTSKQHAVCQQTRQYLPFIAGSGEHQHLWVDIPWHTVLTLLCIYNTRGNPLSYVSAETRRHRVSGSATWRCPAL